MKLLSLLSLSALLTLSASAALPVNRVPIPIAYSMTVQIQSPESTSTSTTASVPAPIKVAFTSKDLLALIAQDEFASTNYSTNSFPTGAKLVYMADPNSFLDSYYEVQDKNGASLVVATNLITLEPVNDLSVYSYKQTIATGLYKPFVRTYVGVFSYDDTAIADGEGVQFDLAQLITGTMNETTSKGVITRTITAKIGAGVGAGTTEGTPAIFTSAAQSSTGKITFSLP
jgi:hypothetical protein